MTWICRNCETENTERDHKCHICGHLRDCGITPVINDFYSIPESTEIGKPITITWSVENADAVECVFFNEKDLLWDSWDGLPLVGEKVISCIDEILYPTLIASNRYGFSKKKIKVIVESNRSNVANRLDLLNVISRALEEGDDQIERECFLSTVHERFQDGRFISRSFVNRAINMVFSNNRTDLCVSITPSLTSKNATLVALNPSSGYYVGGDADYTFQVIYDEYGTISSFILERHDTGISIKYFNG